MFKRSFVAGALAALLLAPGAALANQDGDKEEGRDGKSRYELAPLNYLPLALMNSAQERILEMYFLMQTTAYLVEMTTGVKVTDQNRVSLGGLFGGVFAPTYSAENFLQSLEVGTVYRAGGGRLAVAMAEDQVLADHRIIVFNGDYQYDPRKLPTLQQIEPSQLNKLQVFSLMVELSSHTLPASVMNVVANLDRMNAAELDNVSGLTQAQLQTEIPALRELIVGKVYRGQDNTLLVVIPPSIVLNR